MGSSMIDSVCEAEIAASEIEKAAIRESNQIIMEAQNEAARYRLAVETETKESSRKSMELAHLAKEEMEAKAALEADTIIANLCEIAKKNESKVIEYIVKEVF